MKDKFLEKIRKFEKELPLENEHEAYTTLMAQINHDATANLPKSNDILTNSLLDQANALFYLSQFEHICPPAKRAQFMACFTGFCENYKQRLHELFEVRRLGLPHKELFAILGNLLHDGQSQETKGLMQPIAQQLSSYMVGFKYTYEWYVDTVLLAHKLGLEGKLLFPNEDTNFGDRIHVAMEGFREDQTLAALHGSVVAFGMNQLTHQADRKSLNPILEAIELTRDAASYHNAPETISRLWEAYQNNQPVAIPTGHQVHLMYMVFYKNWVIRVDRGDIAETDRFGAEFYQLTRPIDVNVFHKLIDALDSKRGKIEHYKRYIRTGLMESYDMQPRPDLYMPAQQLKVGSCTWSNSKALLRTLFYLQALEEISGLDNPDAALALSTEKYKAWSSHDRTEALVDYLRKYYHDKSTLTTSHYSFLKKILSYQHDPRKIDEVNRGRIILSYLDDFALADIHPAERREFAQFMARIQGTPPSTQPLCHATPMDLDLYDSDDDEAMDAEPDVTHRPRTRQYMRDHQ